MKANGLESKLLKTFYYGNPNPKGRGDKAFNTHDKLFQNIITYLDIPDIYNLKLTCKTISYSINSKTIDSFLKRFHLTGKRRQAIFSKYLHIEE
jgi:hypothetical protein